MSSILVLSVLVATSLPFAGAGHDDTWIMLFAGESLRGSSSWFLNHNGMPQELSTSVLGAVSAWISSSLAAEGDAYLAWKVFSWVHAILAGMALFAILRCHLGNRGGIFWILVLCCFPHWHYWAWGGLESGLLWLGLLLYAAGIARWMHSCAPRVAWAVSVLAAMLPLIRADALWAPLLLLVAGLLLKDRPLRLRFMPGLAASVAVLGFHCWRYAVTGLWFPNPVYAKSAFSAETLWQGLAYLSSFHAQSALHVFLAVSVVLSLYGAFRVLRCLCVSEAPRPGLFEWSCVLVVLLDLGTIATGGDWMSYHRFAARSLPLKILVMGLFFGRAMQLFIRLPKAGILVPAGVVAALALALTGWTSDGVVERKGVFKALTTIVEQTPSDSPPADYLLQMNLPYRRDAMTLLPWLDHELPHLVAKARSEQRLPLRVASYQAGFFAREIRRRFRPEELLFVDLAGLSDYRIGQLAGPRTALGLSEGMFGWAESIGLGSGHLGQFLATCKPDVVYVLGASREQERLMGLAGYSISYRKYVPINGGYHGAIIFTRTSSDDTGCSGLSGEIPLVRKGDYRS